MKTVFTILCALFLNLSAVAKPKQPNIIFILVDDQG